MSLKDVLAWVDTMAERRDLSEEQQEEAEVLARRAHEEKPSRLPATTAREAVNKVREA